MGTFITVPRTLFDENAFPAEPYSRREAFLDLVQMARHKTETIPIKGGVVSVNRGETIVSIRKLSAKWGWSKGKVEKVINEFILQSRIGRRMDGITTIISITNYDVFQKPVDTNEDTDRDTDWDTNKDADRDNNNNINNINNGNKEKKKDANASKEKANAVERIYALYPASVIRTGGNRSSLKSQKDKQKILSLLAKYTEEQLSDIIRKYIDEDHGAYTKMFSTFLNNLPDYSETTTTPAPPKPTPPPAPIRRASGQVSGFKIASGGGLLDGIEY